MAPKAAPAPEVPATPPPPTSGSGKFFYPNGATYEGEWRFLLPEPVTTPEDGKKKPAKGKAAEPEEPVVPPKRVRHGKGTYVEGAYKYEGDWMDDQIQGQGAFTFASGSVYVGGFVQGKYHGEGTYSWSDGRKYKGGWQNGQMHGDGAYQDAEGHTWSGQFFNGSGPGLTCQL